MNIKSLVLIPAALAAGALSMLVSLPSAPASAQSYRDFRDYRGNEACLQNNRIWSWRVLDQRTLMVSDRSGRPFLVHLGGGCVGLNNAILNMGFNTWTNLGCLRRGDRVTYRAPALGRMTCFVRGVEPYGYFAADRPYRGDYRRF